MTNDCVCICLCYLICSYSKVVLKIVVTTCVYFKWRRPLLVAFTNASVSSTNVVVFLQMRNCELINDSSSRKRKSKRSSEE